MRGLINRVAAMEAGHGSDLSPAAKAWLGQPLTEAERGEMMSAPPAEPADIDASNLSQGARQWLGID